MSISIPRYTERQVKKRPVHQQYYSVQSNPNAFGAGAGRALSGLGGDIQQAGAHVKAWEDEQAATEARNADNQYADWLRERLYNEETGYMNARGEEAFKQRPAFEQEVERARQEFGKNLSPLAGKRYSKVSTARRMDAYSSGIKHSSGQYNVYRDNTQKARMDGYTQDFILSTDPIERDKHLANGRREIKAYAASQGWAPEVEQVAISQWESSARRQFIEARVATDPAGAMRYFATVKKDLLPSDRAAIETSPFGKAAIEINDKATIIKWMTGRSSGDTKAAVENDTDPGKNPIGQAQQSFDGEGKPVKYKPQAFETSHDADRHVEHVPPTSHLSAYEYLSKRTNKGQEAIRGLQQGFAQNLAGLFEHAEQEIGSGLTIYSGYRSPEHQARLFRNAVAKYGSPARARRYVAPPGHSNHNTGAAADMMWNGVRLDKAPKRVRDWVHNNAERFGLKFRMSWEPWHIEPSGEAETTSTFDGGAPQPPSRTPQPRPGFAPVGEVVRQELPSVAAAASAMATALEPRPQPLADDNPRFTDFTDGSSGGIGFTVTQVGPDTPSQRTQVSAYTDAQERINAIEDPYRRAQMQSAFDDILDARDAAEKRAQEAAEKQLWAAAQKGEYDKMPTELKIQAGRSAVTSIENYLQSDKTTNMEAWKALRELQATDPEKFANADLLGMSKDLSPTDLKKFMEEQAKMKERRSPEHAMNISTVMNHVESQLRAIGIVDTPANMGQEQHEQLAQFQYVIAERVEAFQQANGRHPTVSELQTITDQLLLPVVLDDPDAWFDRTKTRVFDIDRVREPGQAAALNLTYEQVPARVKKKYIAELYDRLGRVPSEDEVVDYAEEQLRGQLTR